MIYILVGLVASAVISIWLLTWGEDGYGGLRLFAGVFGIILVVLTGISTLTYVYACWSWIAADSKAKIINREYGTNYTREEVFFAHDVIDTIREIDRKRVEVNGDIMRDKPDK